MILPLEQQVCSLESAKRLKELGCPQESLFYWDIDPVRTIIKDRKPSFITFNKYYSAYTVAELGIFLPDTFGSWNKYKEGWNGYFDHRDFVFEITNKNESEARAKMLIYLLENKLMTID